MMRRALSTLPPLPPAFATHAAAFAGYSAAPRNPRAQVSGSWASQAGQRGTCRVQQVPGARHYAVFAAFVGAAVGDRWRRCRHRRRWGAPVCCASASTATSTLQPAVRFECDDAKRLEAFRELLQELKVDAFIVPTDDPHMSEIPPACFARRAFLSGFTGSAGTAVVTAKEALLWTDGRYFLQAEKELPDGWQLMRSGLPKTPKIEEWLATNLENGNVVGLDPSVHPVSFAEELKQKLSAKSISLQCVDDNPVDTVWSDTRPAYPASLVRLHPTEHAGKTVAEKLAEVRAAMAKEGAQRLIISTLDEVAYLFNLRGADVWRTPFVLAYAVLETERAIIFVDEKKLPSEVVAALAADGVTTRPYSDALSAITEICGSGAEKVWLDPKQTNFAIVQAVGENTPKVTKPSPLALMKARKNASELDGMRAAHRRDAAALITGLASLEQKVQEGGAVVTEVDVDVEVTSRRAEQHGYIDNSFDTIAGYAANGAIIHYRATEKTAATIGTTAPLLIDSGAQYVDGTTDVTRTVHFGKPTERQRECFTRVLQGHIALATAVFPEGTPGFVVDAYARQPLWAAGLDYRHGTGHGVGAALHVHEGPQGIGQRYENKTPLEAGMILSNEPGFYADGEFGIRIENLYVIVERQTQYRFGDRKYFGFEPLTLVPIQREFIDVALLTTSEVAWLNAYHARVRQEVGPLLEAADGPGAATARDWFKRQTEPLRAGDVSAGEVAAATVAVGGATSQ